MGSRPRTCGGYPPAGMTPMLECCSSPHMRGLPEASPRRLRVERLVPAHAGVTRGCSVRPTGPSTRPRTCGGYPTYQSPRTGADSSSPHMRGLPERGIARPRMEPLVPAHAGVTRSGPRARSRHRTRPRTCGGYPTCWVGRCGYTASSPHMRGLPGLARL